MTQFISFRLRSTCSSRTLIGHAIGAKFTTSKMRFQSALIGRDLPSERFQLLDVRQKIILHLKLGNMFNFAESRLCLSYSLLEL